MSDISLTASMRSNLLSLQNTQSLMDTTQERLSTGKKVNSALDNPSSFYTAQSLTNRASDLSALLDSMGQGIQTIKAANEGIESITEFVQQAKSVANQARDEANKVASSSGMYDSTKIEAATKFQLSVTYNGETKSVEVTAPKTAATGVEMAAKIQEELKKLTFGTPATALGGDVFEVTYEDDAFKMTSANGEEAKISFEVGGAKMDATAGNANRVKAISQFNDILDQIDQLAKDSGYKGVNLLGGTDQSLTVIFNEDRSSNLTIQGVDASTKGLDISRVTNWGSNTNIDASIEEVEDAINELRNMASEFGNNYSIVQNREDFTENLINVLEEGSDKLVLADMNEESANMLALQTRQQLGVNSLSLASQAAQAVLKLF
ncbi:MAG: flagellin [Alphaproteobacteria bacterium]